MEVQDEDVPTESARQDVAVTVLEAQPFLTMSVGLQILGLLGIGVFSLLLWGYDHFYSLLGIRPEDVGLDKTSIVGRTAGVLPLALGAVLIGWLLFYRVRTSRAFKIAATAVLLVSTLTICIDYFNIVLDQKRTHLEQGYRITPVRILNLTIFDVRSEPATVFWVGPASTAPPPLRDRHAQFSYLGQTSVITSLFMLNGAPTNGANADGGVVRVPNNDIVVQLKCATGATGTPSLCSRHFREADVGPWTWVALPVGLVTILILLVEWLLRGPYSPEISRFFKRCARTVRRVVGSERAGGDV